MIKPPETHACADCLSARRNIKNYKTVRTSQYHVPDLGLFLVHQFDFCRWILLLFTRWKRKKKENNKSILNASGTESSGKTKKIRLYKRLDVRSGPQNISKTCFYRAFFWLIFVWDRGKAYRRSAHQELTFEWANYTHTHEARRTHDARGATESSSFRRSPRGACISPARLSLGETRDHSQGACMGLLAVYNAQGSWPTWELFILMSWG